MNKLKLAKTLLLVNCIAMAVAVCFFPFATIALYQENSNFNTQGNFPGQVGLRSYFQEGTGTSDNPYVISRPIHFYNLTRLQNIGIFSDKKYYFSLGYDTNGDGTKEFYIDNSSSSTQSYLDMSLYQTSPLLSIGNEGTPFLGDFNGNGLVIKNLSIKSGPEDVGVFGYTYTGSNVHDVYFNNLTITDNGYDESISGITNLFTRTDVGSLTYNSADIVTTSTSFTDLTKSFVATMPGTTSRVRFELRSSSEYLTVSNNSGTWSATINDSTKTNSVYNNTTFVAASGNRINARLSIVGILFDATTGISYSRVLSTYLITFVNAITSGASVVTFKVSQDYVDSTSSTSYTQYAHGVNIGYLIGHCDGSATNCFVYGGTLSLNNTTSNVHPMAQETETGLIGEVGPAIENEYGKKIDDIQSGDTGVINFTKMYSDIIGSNTFSDFSLKGSTYQQYTPVTDNVFVGYLRNTHQSTSTYFTNSANTIDFSGQQVIKDDDTTDRGLGVFELASGETSSADYDSCNLGMNQFVVSKDSANTFDTIYYTTAEFDNLNGLSGDQVTNWGRDKSGDNLLLTPKTIPSFSDDYTWNSYFEKHFNYVIKVPLTSSIDSTTNLNNPDYPNYFSNTNSNFLKKYFSYKLISKDGTVPSYTDKTFGVFIKNVNRQTKVTSNITSFDSYLSLSAINTGSKYSVATGTTTPYSTINFSISSDYGANVTLIGASRSGTGGYISIYDKAVTLASTVKANNNPVRYPAYSMYCPNISDVDSRYYFNYSGNDLTTTATKLTTSNNLYCHTFKIPKGDYFVTSPNGTCDVYYVCVQGQGDKGNYGNVSNTFSNLNTIKNVDFIGTDPSATGFTYQDNDRLKVALKGTFDNTSGDFVVTPGTQVTDANGNITDNPLTITKATNLKTLYILNNGYYSITFNGETFKTQYKEYTA
jgi:hypothetical protein